MDTTDDKITIAFKCTIRQIFFKQIIMFICFRYIHTQTLSSAAFGSPDNTFLYKDGYESCSLHLLSYNQIFIVQLIERTIETAAP